MVLQMVQFRYGVLRTFYQNFEDFWRVEVYSCFRFFSFKLFSIHFQNFNQDLNLENFVRSSIGNLSIYMLGLILSVLTLWSQSPACNRYGMSRPVGVVDLIYTSRKRMKEVMTLQDSVYLRMDTLF